MTKTLNAGDGGTVFASDPFPGATYPLHSIFTHPFGHSRPVYDAPNDGGAATPPADPANPPAPTPPADPANPPADPARPSVTDADAKLLKENMQAKKDLKALQAQLKAFDGIDLEEVKALAQAKKDADAAKAAAEEEAALKRGEFDAVKKQMVDAHAAAMSELRAQLAERDARLAAQTSTIEDLTVGQAFTGSAYIAENLVLTPSIARKEFGTFFDVVDGKSVAFDKPRGAADRAPLVDGNGNGLPFNASLEKLVEAHPERDRLKKSKQVAGAGSHTIDQNPTPPKTPAAGTGVSRIAANLSKLKPLEVKL